MALTREQFIDKLMAIEAKKAEIVAISQQRKVDEEAIALKYKVNECNSERNTLVNSYSVTLNNLQKDIEVMKSELI